MESRVVTFRIKSSENCLRKEKEKRYPCCLFSASTSVIAASSRLPDYCLESKFVMFFNFCFHFPFFSLFSLLSVFCLLLSFRFCGLLLLSICPLSQHLRDKLILRDCSMLPFASYFLKPQFFL